MWSKTRGIVFWTEAAKLHLIEVLKKNIDAITGDRSSVRKNTAWHRVYHGLIEAGMPTSSIDRVKKIWSKMQMSAKAQHRYLQKVKQNQKVEALSNVDQATIELLTFANLIPEKERNPEKSVHTRSFPMPLYVKQEPVDSEEGQPMEETDQLGEANPEEEANLLEEVQPIEEEKRTQDQNGYVTQNLMIGSELNVNMSPYVRLQRIDDVKPLVTSNKEFSSNNYWKIMVEIAQQELQFKMTQREHEIERMENERALHQKSMLLTNLKMQVQQIQLDVLNEQMR